MATAGLEARYPAAPTRSSTSTIAAVLACHNRRELTLQCLRAFFAEEISCRLVAYVFDDGSTDGTGDAVRTEFPQVELISGDGTAFWNRGMWVAFGKALKHSHDYYLWLNDDVLLDRGFVTSLVDAQAAHERAEAPAIIVGAMRTSSGEVVYGGQVIKAPRGFHLTTYTCAPAPHSQPCDTFSGNCVLIPLTAAQRVGNIDPHFFHNYGDFDYGLRARRLACTVWQAPGTIGVCDRNSTKERLIVDLTNGSLSRRWQAFGQARLIHIPSRIRFFVRHLGPWGLIIALAPVRYLLPFARKRLAKT